MSYQIPAHEAAAIFPLMDGNELNQLVADIKSHGLLEPIVMFNGKVLDGRNRLRACELADVEPLFVEWEPNGSSSPTEWVVSHNLHRRHLSVAQRAALALDLLPQLEAEARERQSAAGGAIPGALPPETEEAKGEATEKAADLVGVGRTSVATAKAIQKIDPEIVNRMRSGDIATIQAAEREADLYRGRNGEMGSLPGNSTDALGREMPVYFGKGDKWQEATVPLKRYLAAFEKRGYEFGHVNAKEAKKRVQTIDQLIEALTEARSGLEQRTHTYRLTA